MAFEPNTRAYPTTQGVASTAVLDAGLRAYMLRVYNWMASGLVLTGIIAYAIATIPQLHQAFYREVTTAAGLQVTQPTGLAVLAMLAPLGFVLVLSFGVNRLSRTAAQTLFWCFCAAMGASLTSIFLVYEKTSIVEVFFITAGTFAAMSIWGYTTRSDLTRMGSFLFMGLIVITGLTAYDTQRIKADYVQYAYAIGPDGVAKRSVYDALNLYLNFINLFMLLLQLLGNRNSN